MNCRALLLILCAAWLQGCAQQPGYDVVLRGGTVYDGSGEASRVADVGILGDRIAAIGDLSRERAGRSST